MAKRTKKKQYTLSEFRAWLAGVEEIQPTNWTPDASQWKMIRDKIENIIEEVVEVEVPIQQPVHPIPQGPIPRNGNIPPQPMPTAPPPQDAWGASPGLVEAPSGSALTPAAQAALNGKLPSEMATDTGKSKTPDLDTSDGTYDSSFT